MALTATVRQSTPTMGYASRRCSSLTDRAAFCDSNLYGEFNSGDLVVVFTTGKYRVDEMSGWAEGDSWLDLTRESRNSNASHWPESGFMNASLLAPNPSDENTV